MHTLVIWVQRDTGARYFIRLFPKQNSQAYQTRSPVALYIWASLTCKCGVVFIHVHSSMSPIIVPGKAHLTSHLLEYIFRWLHGGLFPHDGSPRSRVPLYSLGPSTLHMADRWRKDARISQTVISFLGEVHWDIMIKANRAIYWAEPAATFPGYTLQHWQWAHAPVLRAKNRHHQRWGKSYEYWFSQAEVLAPVCE